MKTFLPGFGAAFLVLAARLLGSEIVAQDPRMVPTNDLALSDDGRFVVTLGMRGQLSVWDSRSGSLLETLEGQALSWQSDLAFTPDNRYVSYVSTYGAVVWDWLHRRIAWTRGEHGVTALAVDPARGRIHAAGKSEVSQYSLADGKELARTPLGEVDIDTISLTDKGTLLILCKRTGLLFLDPETRQVTRRIDLGYPRVSHFTPEQIEKKPELAKLTTIAGRPFGRMDRSRSRFRVFFSGKKPTDSWFRTFGTDGAVASGEYPIQLFPNTSPWFGDTGRMLWLRDNQHVEVLDPSDPSRRDPLPISFAGRAVTRIDTDRSGGLIAVSTDKGWFCFEGSPDDHQSWKPRQLPSVPPVVTVRSPHPDGKTMLYGSTSGTIGGVAFEPGLPHRLLGKMDEEVLLIATFPDGRLLASTESDHAIFEEGLPPLFKGKGETHATWNCRDFILRNAPDARLGNAKIEVIRSDGGVLDSFTDKEGWPEVDPVKSLVLYRSATLESARYRLGEITEAGKFRIRHEFERADDRGYLAIPESTDSALLFSMDGELYRIDARSKKSVKLRDGLPDEIGEVHPSADGKHLTVLLEEEPRGFLVPLDSKKPCIELAMTKSEFGTGIRNWVGFTPNQRGVWFDDHSHLSELAQSYAGLWDSGTGKLVARLRVHENGAALILLPDGRCHFNPEATGMVMRRKAGETTLSPVESSPDVFKSLEPYLGKPR